MMHYDLWTESKIGSRVERGASVTMHYAVSAARARARA